ncbi:MAG: hypothetical protein GX652_04430 [Burkholderiaceae bacterium]|nr:hypothetical protein [Burkholderiaceae bacterium]
MESQDEVIDEVVQALLYAAATSVVTLERSDGVLWFQDLGEESGLFSVTETKETVRLGRRLQRSLGKVGDPYEDAGETVRTVRDLVGRIYRTTVTLH